MRRSYPRGVKRKPSATSQAMKKVGQMAGGLAGRTLRTYLTATDKVADTISRALPKMDRERPSGKRRRR